MRRLHFWLWISVIFIMLACQTLTNSVVRLNPSDVLTITPLVMDTPQLGVSPTPLQFIESTPSSSPGADIENVSKPSPYAVRFHPDGMLYVGDQVSMEIIMQGEQFFDEREVSVRINDENRSHLGPVKFTQFGLAGRRQATLYWAWDTSGLQVGDYLLTFTVEPTGDIWQEELTLHPAEAVPWIEQQAHWATTESDCCNIYYLTSTAAERDLSQLLVMVDAQAESVTQALEYQIAEPMSVVFIPRVLGHGGFADQEVSVSYLDRDYVCISEDIILHHEMVHFLDGRIGSENVPSLWVEGLAVFLSGGHFKSEPLMPRAGALLELGWYIPLTDLLDNFYQAQHEISYLEAGALVEYMVNTWGWRGFSDFYRYFESPKNGERLKHAIDRSLMAQFGIDFAILEERFKNSIAAQGDPQAQILDLSTTVDFFNTVRRYQQFHDPSAYFLTAWMVNSEELRKRDIVADYLRHPSDIENLVMETMLNAAGTYLNTSQYDRVDYILSAVNTVLDGFQTGSDEPFRQHPLAADYYQLVVGFYSRDFPIQKIFIEEDAATIWHGQEGADLEEMALIRIDDQWVINKTAD